MCHWGHFSEKEKDCENVKREGNAGYFSIKWGEKCVVVRPSSTCKTNGKKMFVLLMKKSLQEHFYHPRHAFYAITFQKFQSNVYHNFQKVIVNWSGEWLKSHEHFSFTWKRKSGKCLVGCLATITQCYTKRTSVHTNYQRHSLLSYPHKKVCRK